MSRWWADRTHIGLGVRRLEWRTCDVFGRVRHEGSADLDAGTGRSVAPWRPALDRLAREFERQPPRSGTRIEVVLSSALVRYAVVDIHPAARRVDEVEALAARRFARIHGDCARTWAFTLDEAGRGTARLACAVDSALLEALRGLADRAFCRLCSVTPNLALKYNRARARLDPQRTLYALVEADAICVVSLRDGLWRSVHCVRSPASLRCEIARAVARESALHPDEAAPSVMIHASATERVAVAGRDPGVAASRGLPAEAIGRAGGSRVAAAVDGDDGPDAPLALLEGVA